uniref:Uncharacterized protein n=1 Tax=Arundo donax TaxID=35708 RepID=A0A0A9EWA0_ARUDO
MLGWSLKFGDCCYYEGT